MPGVVEFEMAVLIVGFFANLMIGGGIVFTAFTFMSESVSAGAIIGILMSGIVTVTEHWIGRTVIAFDSFTQVEALTIVCVIGAALGATIVMSTFEPRTPATMEANA